MSYWVPPAGGQSLPVTWNWTITTGTIGSQQEQPAGLPLAESPYREPIRVLKLCRIGWDGTRAWFIGAGVEVSYGAVSTAVCAKGLLHEPPDTSGCRCGFHAMKDVAIQPANWCIRAELYGRTAEHKLGWRAQKQRVISIIPPRLCTNCARAGGSLIAYGHQVINWCSNCRDSAVRYAGLPEVVPYPRPFLNLNPVTLDQLQAALAPVEIERMQEKAL